MPRPKPKKGLSVSGSLIAVQFPPSVGEELLEILNLDDSDISQVKRNKLLQKIEEVLTMYPSPLVFLDDAPRPTAKLAQITPLLRAVKQASKIMGELSDDARQDIGKAYMRGIPANDPQKSRLIKESNEIHIPRLYRVREDLKDFIPQLEKAQAYLKTCSSQGGKTKAARRISVGLLRDIFDKYFHSILNDTKTRELQVEFIQTVFKAYNKLNVVTDKLPTDKRAIRSLLGLESPSPQ
jgi:hypothetical protein